MVKRFFFLLSLLFIGHWVMAQPINRSAGLKWGKRYHEKPQAVPVQILGQQAETYLMVRRSAGGLFRSSPIYTLEKYDQTNQLLQSNPLKYQQAGISKKYQQTIYHQGQLYVLYSSWTQNRVTLSLEEYDTQALLPIGEQKIADFPLERKQYTQNTGWELTISPDSSVTLLSFQYKEQGKDWARVLVLGESLQPVWHTQIDLTAHHMQSEKVSTLVNDAGEVFLAGRYNAVSKNAPFSHQVLQIEEEGRKIVPFAVRHEGHAIVQLTMKINASRELVGVGFYGSRAGVISGSCYFSLKDQEMHDITPVFQSFGKEHFGIKAMAPENIEFHDYQLEKVYLRENDEVLMVAEQRKTGLLSQLLTSSNNRYFQEYNHLLVINLRDDGAVRWGSIVEKLQPVSNHGERYASFFSMMVGDNLFLVYNDHPKNLLKEKNRVYPWQLRNANTVLTLTQIARDGYLQKSPLMMRLDSGVNTRPLICRQLQEGEAVLFGQYKHTQRLGKLTILRESDPITSR